MAVQRTLSIIKPDAVAKNVVGDIIRRFEENGLSVIATNMIHLSAEQAGRFYAVHAERPFYKDLCSFMSSGPVLAMCLEGKNAIALNRQLMGATNPKEAEEGTIVPTMLILLMLMPYMALILKKTQRLKSTFSFQT